VLGYHGCDAAIARKAVLEGSALLHSERDYDWLGPGAYFWESDPTRAWEWAQWKAARGDYREPAVVGAVIDLRNCLDLTSRQDVELFHAAYKSFKKVTKRSGLAMPKNLSPKGFRDKDRLLRYLDCAVFRHLHNLMDDLAKKDDAISIFDTVRGMFVEGGKVFPGSGVYRKSHAQIAVRTDACVKGIFYVRNLDELTLA
jgi:hypothetical protein